MRSVRFAFLLLSLTACAWPAAAQVSLEVQGGSITRTAESTRPSVALWGGGVDVAAAFDDGMFEAEACRPCEAGSTVRLGSRIVAAGKGPRLYVGDFTFSAEGVQVPADGAAEVSLTSPFTMAARVSFAENRAADERATGPVFDLEGSGTVTLRLSSIVDDTTGKRLYFFREAVYQFTPSR